MGSSSSSRSHRSKPSFLTSAKERLTPALKWMGSHRYASLGVVAAVCASIMLGMGSSSEPSLINDSDDEIAALGDLGEFETDAVTEIRLPPTRAVATHAEHHTDIDDLASMFDNSPETGRGIMTATFEGPSRSVNAGPVWLAGTIETDDILAPPMDFLPAIPSPARQAVGPLLIPQ